MKSAIAICISALSATLAWSGCQAQPGDDYPNRMVRLISPYAAGGAVDMMGRALAKELSEQMGQSFVLINQGGAGGTIAASQVARAEPDGYTIFLGATGPLAIAPAVYKKVEFDTLKDFKPVSLVATTPYVLVANNSLPVKSVPELIAYAKKHPDQLNFASSGTGGPDHLAGEMFKSMSGIQAAHIPYKGSGPALSDLMAGQVDYTFVSPLPSMPLVNAGKLRLLAVTGKERSSTMPDAPTVAESGLPGFDVTPWYGLLVPAATPDAIVQKLNEQTRIALQKQTLRDLLLKAGIQPKTDTPQEFGAFLAAEMKKWGDVVQAAGIAGAGDAGR